MSLFNPLTGSLQEEGEDDFARLLCDPLSPTALARQYSGLFSPADLINLNGNSTHSQATNHGEFHLKWPGWLHRTYK